MIKHLRDRYARIDALEGKYTRRIKRALLRDAEVALALAAAGALDELVAASVGTKHLKAELDALYLEVMQFEARHEYLYLLGETKAAPGLPIADWLRRARNFIAVESSKAIVAITNTTRSEVKKVLKEAATSGSSVADTARAMRQRVTEFSVRRSKTITRTELLGAANAGSYVGALSTGLALDKIWLATGDGRTRQSHISANGQRVDINQPFIVGGIPCRFPAAPELSARERVRCRCSISYKPKPTLSTGFLNL